MNNIYDALVDLFWQAQCWIIINALSTITHFQRFDLIVAELRSANSRLSSIEDEQRCRWNPVRTTRSCCLSDTSVITSLSIDIHQTFCAVHFRHGRHEILVVLQLIHLHTIRGLIASYLERIHQSGMTEVCLTVFWTAFHLYTNGITSHESKFVNASSMLESYYLTG